jgi:hypothetical protein
LAGKVLENEYFWMERFSLFGWCDIRDKNDVKRDRSGVVVEREKEDWEVDGIMFDEIWCLVSCGGIGDDCVKSETDWEWEDWESGILEVVSWEGKGELLEWGSCFRLEGWKEGDMDVGVDVDEMKGEGDKEEQKDEVGVEQGRNKGPNSVSNVCLNWEIEFWKFEVERTLCPSLLHSDFSLCDVPTDSSLCSSSRDWEWDKFCVEVEEVFNWRSLLCDKWSWDWLVRCEW